MPKKGENIYKRKDNRWEARYIKGYSPEGKIRFGYCYAKTYKEAKEKLLEAKSKGTVTNIPVNVSKMNFSDWCEEWLTVNSKKLKRSTLIKYRDLEIHTEKIQKFKWNTFLASVIIMLAMLVGTLGFSVATSALTSQTYSSLITEGDNLTDSVDDSSENTKKAEEKYIEAITKIDPANIDGYSKLLDLYMKDKVLRIQEYSSFLSLITSLDENGSKDESRYINDLVYNFANDLFFSYENKYGSEGVGISYATKWYKKIADSPVADGKIKSLASDMYIISDNYYNIGKLDGANDPLPYTEYWEKLHNLLDADMVSEGNILIALKTYQFIASQVHNHLPEWRTYNISYADYLAVFDSIQQKTDDIVKTNIYEVNKAELQPLVDNIQEIIQFARKEVQGGGK